LGIVVILEILGIP